MSYGKKKIKKNAHTNIRMTARWPQQLPRDKQPSKQKWLVRSFESTILR